MTYTLEDLKRDTALQKEQLNKRLRDRYKLAKELGFSSGEARVLSLKQEALIRELAKERADA